MYIEGNIVAVILCIPSTLFRLTTLFPFSFQKTFVLKCCLLYQLLHTFIHTTDYFWSYRRKHWSFKSDLNLKHDISISHKLTHIHSLKLIWSTAQNEIQINRPWDIYGSAPPHHPLGGILLTLISIKPNVLQNKKNK